MLSARVLFAFALCVALVYGAEEKHEKSSGTATAPEVDAEKDTNGTEPSLGLSEEKLNSRRRRTAPQIGAAD